VVVAGHMRSGVCEERGIPGDRKNINPNSACPTPKRYPSHSSGRTMRVRFVVINMRCWVQKFVPSSQVEPQSTYSDARKANFFVAQHPSRWGCAAGSQVQTRVNLDNGTGWEPRVLAPVLRGYTKQSVAYFPSSTSALAKTRLPEYSTACNP
jgi:hypothetical protein